MIIVPPTITPRTRPEISSFVIKTIEAHGIRVPPSSRLRRMYDLYHSERATIEPDDPDYEIAIEGDRDMQLLAFAFDQLAITKPSSIYLSRLKQLVSDSPLPQHDREKSAGRDAGFEIFVGAVCSAARLLPVEWVEPPDVNCALNGTIYGLAAKRIKSLGQLNKRVSQAVKQIDRCKLPGVVVMDVGLAFNRDNRRIGLMNDTVFFSEYEANFKVTWSEHQARVQETMARANVLGIIIHDYHIRLQPDGWQLAGMTFRIPAEARTDEEQRRFEKLSTLYIYGLPNQTEESERSLVLP